MNRLVRALLLWVMVIAMPVQAMAAATMRFCGPDHARTMQDAAPGGPTETSGHAMHGTAGSGHAHPEHAGSHAAPSSDAADDGQGGRSPHHGKVSCSACAACCSVLALPAGFSLPGVMAPVQAMQSSASTPMPSHLPDALDRPPRAALA